MAWNKITTATTTSGIAEFTNTSLGKFAFKKPAGDLPSEFQEVEYIQCVNTSGTSTAFTFCNNAVTITNDLVVQAEFENLVNGNGNGVEAFFGGVSYDEYSSPYSTSAYKGTAYSFMLQAYQYKYAGSFGGYRSEESSVISQDINVKHTVLFNNTHEYFILDGTSVRIARSSSLNTLYEDSNIYLGIALFTQTNASYYRGGGKFYSVKAWRRDTPDTLLINYVPCYCTESVTAYYKDVSKVNAGAVLTKIVPAGTIGFYDTINNQFIVNSLAGIPVKGPDK